MKNSLIFRADANTKIGTGHLMRCLALAQAWKENGGDVVFVTDCREKGLSQRLLNEGFDVELLAHSYPDRKDWEMTNSILTSNPGAWVVLDGYHFDENYHKNIKGAGNPLMIVDDQAHLNHYYADIILNQNLHAQQLKYSCESNTRLLVGIEYTLLRKEFRAWKQSTRNQPEVVERIVVTLGGADPDNYTLKTIRVLQSTYVPSSVEILVVVGASNPHVESLESVLKASPVHIRLVHDVTNMAELLAEADMAISGSGSTVWELSYMGVPMLLHVLASNQEDIAESLIKEGNALYFSDYHLQQLLQNHDTRLSMANIGMRLIDGKGTDRVIRILRNFA